MPKQYQQYSIEDFDKFDCLKLSKRFYLVLLFVLRGYLVWLMSVTNMQDRVSTMQWVYPDTNVFLLSLLSGVIGLFVVLIISLRRPNAPNWVKMLWPHCRALLIVALIFDFTINLISFFYWQLTSMPWLICQALIVFALITLCFTSKRMHINLIEFPQTLPDK
ncbi:hypothetical protein CMT41_09980 [Colwellia sp. MT41]|uniref:DUF2919 domain-containing protein n=1 Tax=Colwellia marinimaniae TaxID=1513592 RepID=A0ABQ0MS85_9GAMM|nr:hypothetical protein CMT41_09980 [Colwellia sp. MT41]GAW95233.1 hypothetical protein MTCD1_00832 [Colwellia marinimaniae]